MKIIEQNIGMPILFECSPTPDPRVLPVSNRRRNVLIIDAALDAALDAAQVAKIRTRGYCHQRGAWRGVDRLFVQDFWTSEFCMIALARRAARSLREYDVLKYISTFCRAYSFRTFSSSTVITLVIVLRVKLRMVSRTGSLLLTLRPTDGGRLG